MGGDALRARAGARIERLCAALFDPESLRLELVGELRRAVGFDAYCWPSTDPATVTAGLTVAELPFWADLPRFIHLHHGADDLNRPTVLAASRGHVATLYAATGGDLFRSLHWRESLQPHGIGDQLTAVFVDAYGCWGFVEAWRERARFDELDLAFFDAIAPTITAGLRTAQARYHMAVPEQPRHLAGPAVLVLDSRLRPISKTAAADEWLRILRPTTTKEPQVPGYVYGLVGRLDAVEQGLETLPARLRVQAPNGSCVSLRAARLDGGFGHYAITIETSSPAERIDVLGRAIGLSARERQLFRLAAAGLDTRELSQRLFLSEYTVQQHFKSIFAKTGVNSRRELVSRAMGATTTDS